jgi:hypothetical protein
MKMIVALMASGRSVFVIHHSIMARILQTVGKVTGEHMQLMYDIVFKNYRAG